MGYRQFMGKGNVQGTSGSFHRILFLTSKLTVHKSRISFNKHDEGFLHCSLSTACARGEVRRVVDGMRVEM